MHALTSSPGGVASSRGRGAGNNVGVDVGKRARIFPSGSGAGAAAAAAAATCPAPSPSSALALAKRALALRVVFDAAFASVLRGYDARLEATRRALARRGYRRAQRWLPSRKTAGGVLVAAAVATWYYRANRARWARLAAHREKRAALQRELDAAECYEEYKRVAHAMEALQIAFEETEEEEDQNQNLTPTSDDSDQSSIATSSSSSSGLDKKSKSSQSKHATSVAAAAKKKTRAAKPKASSRTDRRAQSYDEELIEEQLRLLRARRACGDVGEMMFNLRADVLRNLGNMSEIGRKLHEPLWGVPKAVREYIDETRAQLRMISNEVRFRFGFGSRDRGHPSRQNATSHRFLFSDHSM
jgi:TAG lipase/steryl ester hydrolase/phospholipase A2/LPA acyltransferase